MWLRIAQTRLVASDLYKLSYALQITVLQCNTSVVGGSIILIHGKILSCPQRGRILCFVGRLAVVITTFAMYASGRRVNGS